MIDREEDFIMVKEQWYQCQECGSLHREKKRFDIEDDMYIQLKCPNCRGDTSHIWVGEDPKDVYLYGNSNLDSRYYNYNTK